MGEGGNGGLKVHFDARVRVEFHGAKVTSDAGLLAVRELDEALGLSRLAERMLTETRTGRNVQHELTPLLRQSVYSRLAGYEDTNDAERLAQDPAMRMIVSRRASEQQGASTNCVSRFETELLTHPENLPALSRLNEAWVSRAMDRTNTCRIILDLDSSESPVHGEQEGSSYNGHFECVCYHPLFCFNQWGTARGRCCARDMCPAPTTGRRCWSRWWRGIGSAHCAGTCGRMRLSPGRRCTSTWSRRASAMPFVYRPTRRCSGRSTIC